MKRKIGLLIVTILTLIFIPNRVMAADWTNKLICSSTNGFTPGSSVTCTYKVTPPSDNAANGVVGEIEISSNKRFRIHFGAKPPLFYASFTSGIVCQMQCFTTFSLCSSGRFRNAMISSPGKYISQ